MNNEYNYIGGIKDQLIRPDRWKIYTGLALIILISAISFLPVFQNGLLEFDDNVYIKDNPLVHSINLKNIFSGIVEGNYHPITILTLAIEYHFFGLDATGYHAVNLLLHLLNVVLVFYAIFLLSGKAVVALVASLLFGVHPMHVESVAWAAELKDLLYSFFFLGAYIFYIKYLKNKERKYYFFALLLFLVSLLSKAMAVSLPLVLILTDYFKGRKIDKETLLEKAPFFLLAIVFGIVAIFAQKSADYAELSTVLTLPQRLVFASYGFVTYLVKLLFPFNLSAFYPYPTNADGIYMPVHYYLYVLAFIGMAAYIIYSHRFTKKLIFGMGFFTLTILLVLQLLPVGKAIMADRYTYISSIGIFYLAGEGLLWLWNKNLKLYAVSLLSLFTIIFSVQTYARCGIWKDNMTLWNDIIGKDPAVAEAYYKGYFFKNDKNGETIMPKAPELKSGNVEEYFQRASEFSSQGRNEEAINDLNKAVELKPDDPVAYNRRGIVFVRMNRTDEAIRDFSKAIDLKSDYAESYNNRGIVFFNGGKYGEAVDDFNKAIALRPDYALAYNNRGNVFFEEKKYKEAIGNYSKAIELKNDYAQAFYKRGLAESYSGNKEAACKDLEQAVALGYIMAAEAFGKICK